ncbi:hypothetical protein AJ80_06138 [Polytolypa hystricis UAMH7299]|uniref:Major facilitator superfamily (MFS) profile domain-containing protein n=1 Tax=Polytolypa hystricis (strain UAMH7299) TaxID=1447883 RepID=A0A2B7XY69_POLH7|nr:hypothetical protein AJ80_06138 [Polytolypa hystricis UAMH7299]
MAIESDHLQNPAAHSEEEQPLLSTQDPPSFSSHQHSQQQYLKRKFRERPVVFVALCLIILLVIDFCGALTITPQTRIYEAIVCRKYYDEHLPEQFPYGEEIPEEQCKIAAVQGEVALVNGLQTSFDAIPSILLSVSYGRLADSPRYGRKLILILSLVGVLLDSYWAVFVCWFPHIFSLRAVWFGSAFTIIGGGLGVLSSMIVTMISDVVAPENRATAMFQLSIPMVIAQLTGPAIAAWMMSRGSPWPPFLIGVFGATLGPLLLLLLPETIHLRVPNTTKVSASSSSTPTKKPFTRLPNPLHLLRTTLQDSKPIFRSPMVLRILPGFFVYNVGQQQMGLIFQYISTRYHIPLSATGFSLSIYAGVNIFLLTTLLPSLSKYLKSHIYTKHTQPGPATDLFLSKYSILLLTLGCLFLSLAPTLPATIAGLVIYTLGNGFGALLLSLISTFVDAAHIARLYSVTFVVATAGSFVGGPLLAALFNLGLGMGGGVWSGLPFLGNAALHGLVCLAIWSVRLAVLRGGEGGEEGE